MYNKVRLKKRKKERKEKKKKERKERKEREKEKVKNFSFFNSQLTSKIAELLFSKKKLQSNSLR